MPATRGKAAAVEEKPDVSVLIDEGKKAIALKEWEKAAEKYAEALDLTRDAHGESAPVMAPLLLSYGKSLFEIAVSQQGVLGREELAKEQITKTILEKAGASSSAENPAFQFSESVETEEGETVPAPVGDDADGENADGPEDEEPEDEFGEAWEVLDLARAIYEKQMQEDKSADVNRELGDCHLLLGDISLETENFPQAGDDFAAALKYLTPAVPFTDPIIAETHLKIALVYESDKDKRELALEHVQKAIKSTEGCKEGLDKLDEGEREKESKRLDAIHKELSAKLEDLKTAPAAADPVEESIAHLMGVGASASNGAASAANGAANAAGAKVNDLTSMVKKKSKPAAKEAVKAAGDSLETTKEAAADAAEKGKELASDAAEKGKEVASSAVDMAVDLASSAAQSTAAAASSAGQALAEATADAIGAESADVADISKELLHKAEAAAASGFAAVKALAQSVTDQVMAEGVEAMQSAMRDVTETAQDALDGIEAAAAAGKEKVAEFQEEPVVGEKRKPEEEADGAASKKAKKD